MALYSKPIAHSKPLNAIALCAGVGGLEAGLHIAEPGFRTVCYVEREVFPAATLVARMEDKAMDHAPIWSDVKTFDGKPWRGRVHIITGGYPCQPFSFAGKRKGAADPRHLWPDIKRIVAEVEPEWCLFENVEGHLTLGAEQVFNDLRSLGYTVKAGMFSARETGASQIRRRLFIVAHANKSPLLLQSRDRVEPERSAISKRSKSSWNTIWPWANRKDMDADVDHVSGDGCNTKSGVQLPIFSPPPSDFQAWAEILTRRPDLQPELFGLAHGMANRMDRSDAAGNGVVSLAAAYAWRTLKAAHMMVAEEN